ncbi:MAG TPA: histidine phosphatase family protein [Actinomycetota bacterium]|nr:histidine phosphatase family protein [Actinomycetota bacterium]
MSGGPAAAPTPARAVAIRHGDTEWAESGRHTGRTDVPLTERGRREAAALAGLLAGHRFALVLASPLQRAIETCRLAGLGDRAQVRPDLMEWDYGDYEGLTTAQIQQARPGWSLWDDGVPGGETVEQVGERADRVIAEVRSAPGDVALFAHGHVLRILTARWLRLAPDGGRCFAFSPAAIGLLGYEHADSVIVHWNESCSEGL